MKKLKLILTTLILCMFCMGTVSANTISVMGNQAKNATITDIDGNDVTTDNTLNEWKQYTINYHITLNSNSYSNGDTFNVYLPLNVQVKNTFSLPVKPSDGIQIATYSMNKGSQYGTVTVTNTDWLNQHPLKDYMNITFSVYGICDNVNDDTWKVNKVCWFASDGGIMWNVAVNNVSGKDNQLVITDQPSSHQKLKGNTVQVQYGYYDNNGNFVVQQQGALPITKTDDGFYVDLGNYSEKNAQITYETIPDNGYQGYLTNKCQLLQNGKVIGDNSAEIDYNGSANGGGTVKPTSSSSMPSSSLLSSISESSSIPSTMLKSSSKINLSSSSKQSSASSRISSSDTLISSKELSSSYTSRHSSINRDTSSLVSKTTSTSNSSSSLNIKLSSSNLINTSKSKPKTNSISSSNMNNSYKSKSLSKHHIISKSDSSKSSLGYISSNKENLSVKSLSSDSIKSSNISSSKILKANASKVNSKDSSSSLSNNKESKSSLHKTLINNSSTSSNLPNTGEHDSKSGLLTALTILLLIFIIGFILH